MWMHFLITSVTVPLVQSMYCLQEGKQAAGACLIYFLHSGSKHMDCLQEGMQNVVVFLNNFRHCAFGSKNVMSRIERKMRVHVLLTSITVTLVQRI